MEAITAEIYGLDSLTVTEEEEAPRLSFCDLPMAMAENETNPSPITQSAQPDHLFEFFAPPPSRYSDVILFGKFINIEQDQLKRDYSAATKSPKPPFADQSAAEKRRLSASTRVSGDLVQKVNFSSLTSMSAKSRRRMFMFGPVKFRPEMELSAIKQRLATRPPAPAKPSPPPCGGGKSRWGLMKSSLRGRSPLTTVLARSLWCIPAARGGVERWVGVAN
ncbi:hypothetical protein ACS0TY_000572 [Phlomoides rotata]